jgi:hypothetical protein
MSPYFKVAFGGGVFAALFMTIFSLLGRLGGIEMPALEAMLGEFLLDRRGTAPWLLGFFWHLLNGALIGLVYGLVFRKIGAGWLSGALLSVPHFLLAGFVFQTFSWEMYVLHLAYALMLGGLLGEYSAPSSRNRGTIPDDDLDLRKSA